MIKREIEALLELGLKGDLAIPPGAKGLVIFAHSSGSGRHSDRNKAIAHRLNLKGLSTLLVDLLTQEEERIDRVTGEFQFNIPLLAGRLVEIVKWVQTDQDTKGLNVGFFASNTGSAAALVAAAEIPHAIKAIVSRSGRPELAEISLPHVYAATLFIVGERDIQIIQLNQFAYESLAISHKNLQIVPETVDLLSEPSAIKQVADLANEWFSIYLLAGDEDL